MPGFNKTPATLTDILANHDFEVAGQPVIDSIGNPALSAAYTAVENSTLADGAASALGYKATNNLSVLPPLVSPGATLYEVDTTQNPPILVVVVPVNTDLVPALSATIVPNPAPAA